MNVKRKPGAGPNNSFKGAIQVWAAQHVRAIFVSFGQFSKNPVGNFFSIAVIGITLALPAGLYMILNNASQILENWEGSIQIAVYLKPDISNTRAAEISRSLQGLDSVEEITFISKQEALQEYQSLSGFAEAIEALEENPLPNMLIIRPVVSGISSQVGNDLMQRLRGMEEVETAQLDHQWVNRLIAILEILERGVIILITIFSLAVLLIVGNTIRLLIFNKRTEIEIDKLFGATNSFIQRPFLYSGLIYGMGGSLVAWCLLLVLTMIMDNPVGQLAILYGSDFSINGLSSKEVLVLFAAGGGLGFLGSWVAVGRHLKDTEPV